MLQIQNISKAFQDQTLFMDSTFSIDKGERVGMVGRNGSGKSTLFKIILGEETCDEGKISKPNQYIIGSLSQYIKFDHKNLIDECMSVLGEEFHHESYRAEKFLSGLGFEKEDFLKDPMSFSGGYQVRINLVKALLKEPNLLLLDEPTNYLDITSLRWLKNFLKGFNGEVFIITHDRDFMDSVCTHIVGITRKEIKKVKGSTHTYYQKIREEEEIFLKTQSNLKAQREHLEEFITKFKAKASKATQAQSKQKQLDKLGELEDLENDQDMNLNFEYSELRAKTFLECDHLSFGYNPEKTLIDGLSFFVNNGDKVGIIGKNGKGKSTLLNLLNENLKAQKGTLKYHDSVQVGYFGQTNVDRLDMNSTILEEVIQANPNLAQSRSRALCGAMMFSNDQALKKISVLSGGEKSRVMLAKVMAKPTNFLFLDEPTNHLDMQSIDIFQEKLSEYKGSILLVTHSEEFLRSVVNKIIYFKDDNVGYFDGTYDEFLEKIGFDDSDESKDNETKPKKTKKEIHRERQLIIKEKSKQIKPIEKKLKTVEEELEVLAKKEKNISADLEKASSLKDDELILELSRELGELNDKIEREFNHASELEEEINELNKKFENELDKI